MADNYIWFTWSLGLVVIWLIVFTTYRKARKRMLGASLLTMPFGLTEPLFVPEYWHPPSLFDLAHRTGFDIESLIFCFGIGGLGVVLYDLIFKIDHEKMGAEEVHHPRHRFHIWTLMAPVLIFPLLYFLTSWNVIYDATLSMFLAGLAALWCRPDLKAKIWVSGIISGLLCGVFSFVGINCSRVCGKSVDLICNIRYRNDRDSYRGTAVCVYFWNALVQLLRAPDLAENKITTTSSFKSKYRPIKIWGINGPRTTKTGANRKKITPVIFECHTRQ